MAVPYGYDGFEAMTVLRQERQIAELAKAMLTPRNVRVNTIYCDVCSNAYGQLDMT